jgi:hypothetical protein
MLSKKRIFILLVLLFFVLFIGWSVKRGYCHSAMSCMKHMKNTIVHKVTHLYEKSIKIFKKIF